MEQKNKQNQEREKLLKEKLKGYTLDQLFDLVILGLKEENSEIKKDKKNKVV